MIDLFGLRKNPDPEPASGIEIDSPVNSSGEKRLWAVLLVLDTVFLFIFAGAATGMLWVHHSKMAIATQRTRLERKIPPVKAEKTEAPAPAAPAAQPSPAVPAPTKKEAASSKRSSSRLPLGSPSVLAPDLPHRNMEPVQSNGQYDLPRPPELAAPQNSAGPRKAIPTEFTCHAPNANEVLLKGPFLVRTGGLKKMIRAEGGIWHTTISLLPGTYKYRCVIDGKRSKSESIDVK